MQEPDTSISHENRKKRWASEAEFFDKSATDSRVAAIDPLVVERYRNPGQLFHKECMFSLVGGLSGKRVLDIGCGEGANSILLAKLGAHATGIDISPKAIEIAKESAALSGVSQQTRFVCSPIESASALGSDYDLIWGDAILHHLIDELDLVVQRLASLGKDGATIIFAEPINFNQTLRRIRFMVPVETDTTPDERPLERSEIAILRRSVTNLQLRHFKLLGRLNRFLLTGSLERASLPRRVAVISLAAVDRALLALPFMRQFAAYAVISGSVQRSRNSGSSR